jgi:glycosyltransferase involved in cell wall biosynthesis
VTAIDEARREREGGENEPSAPGERGARRICVVGPGTMFLSGITYYTLSLVNALEAHAEPSALLMRRLLPRRLYPGRTRVGAQISELALDPGIPAFDGVDWYTVPSLARAVAFLRRTRPEVVVFQWWTGAVLHNYLALAHAARALGARVVIEFHEAQDVGEGERALARGYVGALAPRLFARADAFVVHSAYDRDLVVRRYGIPEDRTTTIPLALFEHHRREPVARSEDGVCRLLYLGVIRPFKGVEDLVRAFDRLSDDDAQRYELAIVGETWEGHTEPAELIARSRHAGRIRFVNRYVTDAEASEEFARADIVVLPYHRSSASGPLQIAMANGLPVVTTAVGGLVEATATYEGAVLVQPRDPHALLAGIRAATHLRSQRFAGANGCDATAQRYVELAERLLRPAPAARR